MLVTFFMIYENVLYTFTGTILSGYLQAYSR
jgi:hypothetical protein